MFQTDHLTMWFTERSMKVWTRSCHRLVILFIPRWLILPFDCNSFTLLMILRSLFLVLQVHRFVVHWGPSPKIVDDELIIKCLTSRYLDAFQEHRKRTIWMELNIKEEKKIKAWHSCRSNSKSYRTVSLKEKVGKRRPGDPLPWNLTKK